MTVFVLLLLCACKFSAAQKGSQLSLDGTGIIPDYHQLLSEKISDTVILWCQGGLEATNGTQWLLPDGTHLSNTVSSRGNATVVSCLQSLGLFAANGPGTLSLSGVYMCIVPFRDGHVETHRVWILKRNSIPSFDKQNSDCVITNVDPFQSLITVSAGGQIIGGAASSYTCHGQEIAEFRRINKALSPTRMTVLKLFSVSSGQNMSNSVNCTASNTAGSDTLECNFERIDVTQPMITRAARYANDTLRAQIDWTPSSNIGGTPLSLYYSVYAIVSDMSNTTVISGTITGDNSAILTELSQTKSFRVIVAVFSQQTQARIMPLPVFSQSQILTAVQCRPAKGYDVEMKLESQNVEICDILAKQNGFLIDIMHSVIGSHKPSDNCTLVEPKVLNFKCNDMRGRIWTRTQKKKLSLTTVVFCQPCQEIEDSNSLRDDLKMSMKKRKKENGTTNKKEKTKNMVRTNIRTKCKKIKLSVKVRGIHFDVTLKTRDINNYCNQTRVTTNDTCDCPEKCF